MNILVCIGLLICICTAYASALPRSAVESSSSVKVAHQTPEEILAPEESQWGGGYGHGGGGRGGGGWGGGGWGGGRGGGGNWGGGRGWGGGWGGGHGNGGGGYGWGR
ncbi:unnamed protein product [Euphydryas editha]|uniref:Uncharacterized protein n=1 Tax=Euphydryas editha TaxID=104508 RepID=A0AAU9TS78_EUPED|nr:unnamed protein product [Euphydryas editha]